MDDMASVAFGLKEYYNHIKVGEMIYSKHPLRALMPKDEDAAGDPIVQPTIYGEDAGQSADFATAQANQTSIQGVRFLLSVKADYSLGTMALQAVEAARKTEGAFFMLAKEKTDIAFKSAASSVGSLLFRKGTGSRSSITTLSTGVITLNNPRDARFFFTGMVLNATATDGGTARAGLGYVIARSAIVGTITVSATKGGAAGNPSGWSTGDFLVRQGDINKVATGLTGWLPTDAEFTASPIFNGVDRTPDRTKLGGVWLDVSNKSVEEGLLTVQTLLVAEEGSPGFCFLNPVSWNALRMEQGTKAEIEMVKAGGDLEISFESLKVRGETGTMRVVADPDCPPLNAFLLEMDTWKLYSYGPATQLLPYPDGQQYFRVANADALELRVGGYLQVGCSAPGHNARALLCA